MTDRIQELINEQSIQEIEGRDQLNVIPVLLFDQFDRHVSAEQLFEEARQAKIAISLATVYNTLNQFTDAGLLRAISIDSTRIYYDTKTGNHHHFFMEDSEELHTAHPLNLECAALSGGQCSCYSRT